MTIFEEPEVFDTPTEESSIVPQARKRRQSYHSHQHRRSTTDNAFFYKPLDKGKGAVRLIRIYPLTDNGQIMCKIERHHVSTAEYTALSYVWGSEEATHSIFMNGCRFRVRPNLYAFLRHVSKTHHLTEKLYWIDAICIDQGNIEERHFHVRHMNIIYSNAAKVIAWLNTKTVQTKSDSRPPKQWTCCVQAGGDRRELEHHRCGWTIPRLESWDVICNPYWQRLWIAQELNLAKRVDICWRGRFYDWSRLRGQLSKNKAQRRNMLLHGGHEGHDDFMRATAYIEAAPISKYFNKTVSASLGDLVPRFQDHQCQIGHDHVYGLLSIASDGDQFEPQYEESALALLLRFLSFCYKHPTSSVATRVGKSLGLNPRGDGIRVEVVGAAQLISDVSKLQSYFRAPLAKDGLASNDLIIIKIPDTNLHLLFAMGHAANPGDAKRYHFVSTIDMVFTRIEMANAKFGHGKNARAQQKSIRNELKHLPKCILHPPNANQDARLYCRWPTLLEIFELSTSTGQRGRLESQLRAWLPQSSQQNGQSCVHLSVVKAAAPG